MTPQEWTAEAQRRIAISEGREATAYTDERGVLTIGIGFNLTRPDAAKALAQIGANYTAVVNGQQLSDAQIDKLFAYSWAPIVVQARASLDAGIYDQLSDARRFVICDLVYNMGPSSDGWGGFSETQSLICQATRAKELGATAKAVSLFSEAADHLAASAWYGQIGNRARRDVAMMRTSNWCDPNGDGSDAT